MSQAGRYVVRGPRFASSLHGVNYTVMIIVILFVGRSFGHAVKRVSLKATSERHGF